MERGPWLAADVERGPWLAADVAAAEAGIACGGEERRPAAACMEGMLLHPLHHSIAVVEGREVLLLLQHVVDVPTRGGNILHLAVVNDDKMVKNVDVRSTLMSDHRLIAIETMLLITSPQKRCVP